MRMAEIGAGKLLVIWIQRSVAAGFNHDQDDLSILWSSQVKQELTM